ncbi:MAG: tRNA pseudouridine(38-40) synthase TruA [Pseudomonadota bacterium]
MPRFKLTLEYDGGPFAGWQRQPDQPSVQARVEEALRALEADAPGIKGAGRTDAGVHATGQAAHCDLRRDWDPFRLSEALNHHLKPEPVAVLAVERVHGEFHARFDAVERRYLYRLIARRAPLTIERGRAWRVPGPLDAEAMREGAACLVGRHDFTTFRSSICQAKSPVKTLDEIGIRQDGALLEVRLRARSFLHNQVRSIVGTLEKVGTGRWAPERVGEALAARDRAACGPVAPPDGLYLTRVIYPDDVDRARGGAVG